MEGKTVIAIAHRLSTIARMDRLVVIEQGRIVGGTHDELLRLGGHYEKLWRHQSGGFLADDFFASDIAEDRPSRRACGCCSSRLPRVRTRRNALCVRHASRGAQRSVRRTTMCAPPRPSSAR